jgi:hypothetical protein
LIAFINMVLKHARIEPARRPRHLSFAPMSQGETVPIGPEAFNRWKRATQIAILGSQHLNGSAAMELLIAGIFNRIHKCKRLVQCGQGNPVVPAFEKSTGTTIPVIATVGNRQ